MFTKNILMCRPDHFNIQYSINPWMDVSNKVNQDEAYNQWTHLHHMIIRFGGYVWYVEPDMSLPDMCFTANAGLYYNNKIVLSQFKHKERQREADLFLGFFTDQFEFDKSDILIPSRPFEGAGDSFVVNDTLFLGHGFRTDHKVGEEIIKFLGLSSIVYCELIMPEFYHLDTCFCPIGDGFFYYQPAFSASTNKFLSSCKNSFTVKREEEALRFACNSVVLPYGKTITVIMPTGCEITADYLMRHTPWDVRVYHTDLSQFLKAGGSAKCLTMDLGDH